MRSADPTPTDEADALSALAPLLRVRPELQTLCRFGAPWASPHAREPCGWAPFHMVTAGACVLDVEGETRQHLRAGDIALMPHGDAHVVRGLPPGGSTGKRFPLRIETTNAIDIKSNTDHPDAELICGRLTFEQPSGNLALAALPRLIVIRTETAGGPSRLTLLLMAIREEIMTAAPGARAICGDLASALLVMVLRAHLANHIAEGGILRLLGQRQTARALAAMMHDLARAWTLDEIAASARTSRATLVRDFRRLAGATPFSVLAELRLGIARRELVSTDRPLADIAADVGYQSSSAFSRAFQRRFALTPGEVRSGSLGAGQEVAADNVDAAIVAGYGRADHLGDGPLAGTLAIEVGEIQGA